jgi:hypothetical protein
MKEQRRKEPHFVDEGIEFELIPGATKEEHEAHNEKLRQKKQAEKK